MEVLGEMVGSTGRRSRSAGSAAETYLEGARKAENAVSSSTNLLGVQ